MACNCLNNPHYKSTSQFYNNTNQIVATTNTVLNPLVLNLLGSETTNTGCAITLKNANIEINGTGTYDFKLNALINATAAGEVTIAMRYNGVVLPETAKTVTLVTTTTNNIVIDDVKYIKAVCNTNNVIDFVAYSDGAAVADITISGNVVKLA